MSEHGEKSSSHLKLTDGLSLVGLACIAGLVTLSSSNLGVGLVGNWAVLATAGLGFYLAFGLAGQFSFAHAAFVGIGSYVAAKASLGPETNFIVNTILGAAVAFVVGILLYLLLRRSSAFYFGIATMAFGYLANSMFRQWTWFAGAGGERHRIPRISIFGTVLKGRGESLLLVLVVVICLFVVLLLERSPVRRVSEGLRAIPVASKTLAHASGGDRLWLFGLGCAFAGIAGVAMAHRTGTLTPEMFDIPFAIDIFLVLLLGGVGSAWGPILGAAFVVVAQDNLRFIGGGKDLIFGALLVVIMIYFPEGLVGIATSIRRRVSGSSRVRGRSILAPVTEPEAAESRSHVES